MTTPFGISNPGEHLQRERRCHRFYTDQHGRKFSSVADTITQQPIGEMRPSGWVAPWLPPMRYAKWQEVGELNFRWDYTSMADEWAEQTAAYYEQATKFALEHNLPDPEVGGVVDRRIQAVYGPPPMSPEIPLSAEAGDPWLLGLPGAPRNDALALLVRQGVLSTGGEALTAIKERIAKRMGAQPDAPADVEPIPETPVTYQEFIKEGRKNGMSMADLAIAWKAHKENSLEPAEAAA